MSGVWGECLGGVCGECVGMKMGFECVCVCEILEADCEVHCVWQAGSYSSLHILRIRKLHANLKIAH